MYGQEMDDAQIQRVGLWNGPVLNVSWQSLQVDSEIVSYSFQPECIDSDLMYQGCLHVIHSIDVAALTLALPVSSQIDL